jgi:hypothetical protein
MRAISALLSFVLSAITALFAAANHVQELS